MKTPGKPRLSNWRHTVWPNEKTRTGDRKYSSGHPCYPSAQATGVAMGEGTSSMDETKTTTPSSLQAALRSRPAAASLELLVLRAALLPLIQTFENSEVGWVGGIRRKGNATERFQYKEQRSLSYLQVRRRKNTEGSSLLCTNSLLTQMWMLLLDYSLQ